MVVTQIVNERKCDEVNKHIIAIIKRFQLTYRTCKLSVARQPLSPRKN